MSKKAKPAEKKAKRAKAPSKKSGPQKKAAKRGKPSPRRRPTKGAPAVEDAPTVEEVRDAVTEALAEARTASAAPTAVDEQPQVPTEETPAAASVTESEPAETSPTAIEPTAVPEIAPVEGAQAEVAVEPSLIFAAPVESDERHVLPPAGTVVTKYDRRGVAVSAIQILEGGKIRLVDPPGVDKIFDSPTGAALAHTRMLGNETKAINGWIYWGFQKAPVATPKASPLERLLARRARAQETLAEIEAEISAFLGSDED